VYNRSHLLRIYGSTNYEGSRLSGRLANQRQEEVKNHSTAILGLIG
jgi:hypothetical protein